MAVNYASKYAGVVDERFRLGSLTQGLINQNFDWLGVQTVKIFSRDLASLNDYQKTGSSRYGTPDELGNAEQEMTITQDKSQTWTIDAASEQDTNGTMEAGATLAENIDNVVIPAMDAYRLAVLVANAPAKGTVTGLSHVVVKAVTKANAYEEFLAVQEILDNDKAPQGGRIAVVTPSYYNKIKLDENFTKKGDMATQIAINGVVGEIDGVPVIKVPSSYLPANVDFIITNPVCAPAPVKLQEMKINYNAPGISGALVESRFRYDCFVLDKKADAIGVHVAKTLSSIAITTAPTKTAYTSGESFDPTGMVVTATYSDSTTTAVTGYTYAPEKITAAGNVTVTYMGKTATQAVTIAS